MTVMSKDVFVFRHDNISFKVKNIYDTNTEKSSYWLTIKNKDNNVRMELSARFLTLFLAAIYRKFPVKNQKPFYTINVLKFVLKRLNWLNQRAKTSYMTKYIENEISSVEDEIYSFKYSGKGRFL